MAIESVTVNSRNSRFGNSFINSSGRNIVISDRFIDSIVKSISRVFCSAVCNGFIFVFR